MAKLPETIKVAEKDTVSQYILVSNSHDGSGAIKILPTPIRVVCNNTLTWALRKGHANQYSFRHTKNASERVEAARKVLRLVNLEFGKWEGRVCVFS